MAESKTCQHRNRQRFTGANESYTCLDCGADLSLTDLGIKQRNIERLETELAAANEQADKALKIACKPWEHCVGEPPEWGSPLGDVWQAAIEWCQGLVAKKYGIKEYDSDGGTETIEGDTMVGFTNIIHQITEQSLASERQAAFAECIRLCRSHARKNNFGAGGALACVELIQNAQSLPPTHMFVPKEPTEEMLIAAANSIAKHIRVYADDLSTAYKAMLAAHGGGGE